MSIEEDLVVDEDFAPENDLAFLEKMRDTLSLLSQYASTFDDEQAVCQAQIKTLVESCGIKLNDRYPVESFTQLPSAQNFQPAMEGLLNSIVGQVKAFFGEVWDFILKTLDWIGDFFKRLLNLKDKAAIKEAVARTKTFSEQFTDLMNNVGAVKVVLDKVSPDTRLQYQQALDAYESQMSELGEMILEEDPIIGVVKGLLFNVMDGLASLASRVQEASSGIETAIQSSNGIYPPELKAKLLTAETGSNFEKFVSEVPEAKDKAKTLDELLAVLYQVVKTAADTPAGKKEKAGYVGVMPWEVALHTVADGAKRFEGDVVPLAAEVPKLIDGIKKHIQQARSKEEGLIALMNKRVKRSEASQKMAVFNAIREFKEVLMAITKEASGYNRYTGLVGLLNTEQTAVLRIIGRMASITWNVYVEFAKVENNPHVIEAVNKAAKLFDHKVFTR